MAEDGISNYIKYVKAAFTNHWNLLYLGTFFALGLISGYPDILFPISAAFELLYLAVISSNTRFQALVEAKENSKKNTDKKEKTFISSDEIIARLGREDRKRFDDLLSLCRDLLRISEGVRNHPEEESSSMKMMQNENIDRLLWIYLKLLFTKASLDTFFRTIDEIEITSGLKSVQTRLDALGPEHEDDAKEAKYRRSLLDTYHTLDVRLKNYKNAKENYDFVLLELERLYTKIAGIAEMSITRQDPDFISVEIDVISSSVIQTEKTMQELESITGLTFTDETPPPMMRMEIEK